MITTGPQITGSAGGNMGNNMGGNMGGSMVSSDIIRLKPAWQKSFLPVSADHSAGQSDAGSEHHSWQQAARLRTAG